METQHPLDRSASAAALIYLVDRITVSAPSTSGLRAVAVRGGCVADVGPLKSDHLTHNVRRGNMKLGGFLKGVQLLAEIRYFVSRAGNGCVFRCCTLDLAIAARFAFPSNESQDDRSQIEEYPMEYKGEGIQHIAGTTATIYRTGSTCLAQSLRSWEFQDDGRPKYSRVSTRASDGIKRTG